MKIYFILSFVFILGFSIVQIPVGFSINSKNNSFTYYEKNCDNHACVVTTCDDGKTCHTSGVKGHNNTDTLKQIPNQKFLDSKALNFMEKWKNYLDFNN